MDSGPISSAGRVVLREETDGDWLHFECPRRILTTCRTPEVLPLLREADRAVRKEGMHAAGFVAYEAAPAFDASFPCRKDGGFPLLWFGLYEEVRRIDRLPCGPQADPPGSWVPSLSAGEYAARLEAIRRFIRDGETYQVNFTYRLRAETAADPWALFLRITAGAPPPCAAFVDTGRWAICSASPELFFRLNGGEIESRPMKGTAPRGLWSADDLRKAAELRSSEKNRAENVMIVDMVRNDLGRIAACGSVHVPSLFALEKYANVWQMTSTVRARTDASIDRIFAALFPPASVTGAPKRRTLEIIAELETSPRRIYTGAIGYMAPGCKAQFNVAIRTILADRASGRAEYGVGGGIVWDSDPTDEFRECASKARILRPARRDFDLLETMLWTPESGYVLLERHLERLAASAAYFGFDLDPARIRAGLEDLARGLPKVPHRVRLLVARKGSFKVEQERIARASRSFGDVRLAGAPVDSGNVFLYHKTTERRVYEEALRSRPGGDVLLFNERGEITETPSANVAFEIGGRLWTPPVSCGLLPGTCRAHLLDRGRLRERIVRVEEALRLPAVYLMNSVRGIVRVRILAGCAEKSDD